MTMEELREYCMENSMEPEDQNEPFIIGFKLGSQANVCIVWSSKKLLQLQRTSHTFSVDGTYKLMSLNWPVLRCGFSDARNRFHSTGIALVRHEDGEGYKFLFEAISKPREQQMRKWEPIYIMADGDAAITAGKESCWPNTIRTTCFFHLMKNVREKMRAKPAADYLEEVLGDIRILKKAGTYFEFIKAARVLNNHWMGRFRNQPQIKEIMATFIDFYVKNEDNCGWFSGIAPESPTTNNGTESSNRQLKERDTERKRLPIREFLDMAMKNISVASLSPEHQNPIWLPPIPIETFKEAFELEKERRTLVEMRDADDAILIPSSHGLAEFSGPGAHQMIHAYEHLHSPDEDAHPFQSWAEYKIIRAKFHFIRHSSIWPTYYYCSCTKASQRKPCKHSVLVMKMKGHVNYPAAITAERLLPAKKRGRPNKAMRGQALIIN